MGQAKLQGSTLMMDRTAQPNAAAGLQCELVKDFARLEELSAEWNRLWRSSSSEIFQQFAWTRAFWNTCGSNLSLCSLVVHDGAEIIGVLPLASDGKTIRFLAEADYNDIICEEHRAAAVLAATMEALLEMPWRTCILDNLSANSRVVRHMPGLPLSLRKKMDLVFACPCPTTVSENGQDLFAKLARKDSLRRHENKLQRKGRLTFRHVESRREIHEHLPHFFHQQIARRALLGQHSHFQDPAKRAFYAALVDELDPRSELRFAVLELDTRPIAYHFGFQLNGKLIWYQSGFDVDLWHCSPGEVLIRRLLLYAHETGLRELDFTIGGEMYKSRFANLVRNNFALQLERNPRSLTGMFRRLATRVICTQRKLRQELKKKPHVYNALKKKWLAVADWMWQQRRLYRRAGLLGYARLTVSRILRNHVFAIEHALVFSATKRDLLAAAPQPPAAPLKICSGTFSELALLSIEYPDEFPWSKLHVWRERLTKGDQMYTLRSNDELAHIVWMAARNAVAISELGNSCHIPLAEPAMVIDSCWSAPNFRAPHLWLNGVQLLAQKVADKLDAWIYCLNPDRSTRKGFQAAGFRLRRDVLQIRILGALRRHWIRGSKA
jgi:CelD/BcsL family acetyltransferase involved in cellulose biosynthesis